MEDVANRILRDIRKLAPSITARAAEIEAARRIPIDLVDTLRSIGVFRMFTPRSHDGLEFDLPSSMEILASVSRVDGSLGWVTMIGSVAAVFLSLLPGETFDQVYKSSPDVIVAGTTQPVGTAERVDGGWRVSGRWPFASGCQHADWMLGFCVMSEEGKPVLGPTGESGAPIIRGVALPARDWHIADTWHASGLKGTGSNDIILKSKVVPAANFFDFGTAISCLPGPLYQGAPQVIPLAHCAVAVGMAEGALDDIIAMASTGRQQFRATMPMRDSEIFQGELGRVAAEVRAARAFFQVQVASHWRHAQAGTLKSEALLMQGTQTAIWISSTCARVAEACFALGGGSAVYETSPLPRRLRDLRAAVQHAAVAQRRYADSGRLILASPTISETTFPRDVLAAPSP
jgi:indole-3-acetate monooxygenase